MPDANRYAEPKADDDLDGAIGALCHVVIERDDHLCRVGALGQVRGQSSIVTYSANRDSCADLKVIVYEPRYPISCNAYTVRSKM